MKTLIALLALALPVFPAQEGKPERHRGLPQAYLEAEAGYAASALSEEALIPEALLAEVREVLRKVRASGPEVANLRVYFKWDLRSLVLNVGQELFDRIREY